MLSMFDLNCYTFVVKDCMQVIQDRSERFRIFSVVQCRAGHIGVERTELVSVLSFYVSTLRFWRSRYAGLCVYADCRHGLT
jgi:hypothetical protein